MGLGQTLDRSRLPLPILNTSSILWVREQQGEASIHGGCSVLGMWFRPLLSTACVYSRNLSLTLPAVKEVQVQSLTATHRPVCPELGRVCFPANFNFTYPALPGGCFWV